jgi:hypothetical protein
MTTFRDKLSQIPMIPKDVELISSYGSDPKNRYFYTMVLDSDPGNCTWPGTPFRCNMDVFLYLFNCILYTCD